MDDLQSAILRTLLYFDMFDYPLKLSEILSFLPSNSVADADLRLASVRSPLCERLAEKDGYYYLKGRPDSLVKDRLEKERRARRQMRIAHVITRIIRSFPFVRGVFVSGELSKGVASKKSDIDFFVVTAPNRIWITRTFFALFKKVFLLNRKTLFCYNHITSDRNLAITERNIYTAMEVATLRPTYNPGLYRNIMIANEWIKAYLPNSYSVPSESGGVQYQVPLTERMLESIVSAEFLDGIDQWLLGQWRKLWHRRYCLLSPENRERLYRCEAQLSTAYGNDFQPRITQAYKQRLEQFGLTATSDLN
jgi:hypothetical protein